jgi:hypothetical protein
MNIQVNSRPLCSITNRRSADVMQQVCCNAFGTQPELSQNMNFMWRNRTLHLTVILTPNCYFIEEESTAAYFRSPNNSKSYTNSRMTRRRKRWKTGWATKSLRAACSYSPLITTKYVKISIYMHYPSLLKFRPNNQIVLLKYVQA